MEERHIGRTWGYRSDGKGGVESKLFEVECDSAEEAKYADPPEGWVGNPGLVTAEPVAEDTSDEVEALRRRANELGIEVDGRWGVQRLRGEIEAAEQAEAAIE